MVRSQETGYETFNIHREEDCQDPHEHKRFIASCDAGVGLHGSEATRNLHHWAMDAIFLSM